MRPREIRRRTPIKRSPITDVPARPYVPDRDLTFYRNGARWSFTNDRVMIDGYDVNGLIGEGTEDVGLWVGIAQGLDDYRKKVTSAAREADEFMKFGAVVEALLGKILGKLKKTYDQKTSGLRWQLENGELILNGINVLSFLALYRVRKTEKARQFLKGLKTKLSYLLENRHESPDNERIREVIERLNQEIDAELKAEEAARTPRRLVPPRSRNS